MPNALIESVDLEQLHLTEESNLLCQTFYPNKPILYGTNVNEWKDNMNNSATKNKEIYFFVGSWNVEMYTANCVSSHYRKG